MFILKKEVLKLIDEETDKVLQEAFSQGQLDAIRGVFKDARKTSDQANDFIDRIRIAPGLDNLSDDELADTLRFFDPELEGETVQALARAIKGTDAPEPTASMTRGPDAGLADDVASDAAEEGIAARKVIDLGDGELLDQAGEVFGRVSGVDLEPEQTRQVLAIVRRSDNLPAVVVADDLAKAIDLPEFNTKRALAALAALGVVTAGGKIAWDNFGIAAAGEDDVVGRPVPIPGGGSPASLPPTGGTGDAGWDKYLKGSQYVTAEQARQVYDAWIEYVNSKEAALQEEISEEASFANFVQWWRDNKKAGNLGRWGSWQETIKYLKAQTKKPEDTKASADSAPEVAPAPAASAAPASEAPATPAAPTPSDIDKALTRLRTALEKQKELETNAENSMPEENDPAKKRELQKKKDMARRNIDKLERQIKQIERRAANIAKRTDKKIGRLSESVYNRWQKIIKG